MGSLQSAPGGWVVSDDPNFVCRLVVKRGEHGLVVEFGDQEHAPSTHTTCASVDEIRDMIAVAMASKRMHGGK